MKHTNYNKKNIYGLFYKIPFFCSIIYIILIKPRSIILFPTLNSIFNICISILSIFIVLYYILNRKNSKIIFLILIFILSLLFSTHIGTKDYSFYTKLYFNYFITALYTDVLLRNNKDVFYKSMMYVIPFLIGMNFITIIIFPNGINNIANYFFLGYDNASIISVILGLVLMAISSLKLNNKLTFNFWLSLVLAFLSYFIVWAASCLVNIVLFIVFVLFILDNKNIYGIIDKVLNIKFILFFSLAAFIFLVILRGQNSFEWLIVDILHKNLTLTGRTYIWDRCLTQISNNFWFGLGVEDYSTRFSRINIYHAHSTYLNILLEGGMLAFINYLNIFIHLDKKQKKYKSTNKKVHYLLLFGLLLYFTSTIIDVIYSSQFLYILIVLFYFYNENEGCEANEYCNINEL